MYIIITKNKSKVFTYYLYTYFFCETPKYKYSKRYMLRNSEMLRRYQYIHIVVKCNCSDLFFVAPPLTGFSMKGILC